MSHVRMFDFWGGVPELVIPDNEKAAVHKASRYEPVLNPTYQELAAPLRSLQETSAPAAFAVGESARPSAWPKVAAARAPDLLPPTTDPLRSRPSVRG